VNFEIDFPEMEILLENGKEKYLKIKMCG